MTRAKSGNGRSIAVQTKSFTGNVHIREDGPADGPRVLLLHGFSGSLHWFDRAVPLLADTFRVVRLDLVGHGHTGGRAVDAPAQCNVVEAVLAELEYDEITAIGHSFGADVAVELAERSDRVARLVIVAQAPDYTDATLPRAGKLIGVPVLGAALPHVLRGVAAAIGPLVISRVRGPGRELAQQALHDFRALDARMFQVILVDRRTRLANRPLDAQVSGAEVPILVLLGERDHFYGARPAARYEAAGAEVVVLADCGHSPLLEQPERSTELIRAFIAKS